LIVQLVAVARAKLLEPLGDVVEPASQLVAGCQLARPLVQLGALARDPTRPDVVDQDAIAVARLDRVIDAFGAHVNGHRRSRPGMCDDAAPEALGAPDAAAKALELDDPRWSTNRVTSGP